MIKSCQHIKEILIKTKFSEQKTSVKNSELV